VVVEACEPVLECAGESLASLHGALAAVDYQVFVIGRVGLERIRHWSDAPDISDWVGVPRSKAHLAPRISKWIWRVGTRPFVAGFNPLSRVGGG
jgi:hypothetical protein